MLATSLDLVTKHDYLEQKFKNAYQWLKEHDTANMEDGTYDICDGVFAMVQRYDTIPFSEARFESHKDYYDIQYIAKGTESFGMALVKDCELVETIEKNDVSFYKTPKFYTQVNLKSGDLVVVPPEEVHQPRAQYNGQKDFVVKVVIKVKV
ncbi:MAG: YhcH/YjgK/YiaL family protein [Succinivibrio sp.]|nr:YhcH/YjgK/YiaL family protein [Succinivibrio sp.]MCI5638510.1 YhcH/YjgK/YiaL family protein [Succinivibrio sp.]MCI6450321.1 YhcH/YjgK/YiaL family protein [Succinivibrio sp.]MCI7772613.1 YhcH/YjgK/YiaL family protein [Succinivibrio sp.]MDD6068260.1 YhcH/YjgK/YiaL family protein [Succinivibrio sp.]